MIKVAHRQKNIVVGPTEPVCLCSLHSHTLWMNWYAFFWGNTMGIIVILSESLFSDSTVVKCLLYLSVCEHCGRKTWEICQSCNSSGGKGVYLWVVSVKSVWAISISYSEATPLVDLLLVVILSQVLNSARTKIMKSSSSSKRSSKLLLCTTIQEDGMYLVNKGFCSLSKTLSLKEKC